MRVGALVAGLVLSSPLLSSPLVAPAAAEQLFGVGGNGSLPTPGGLFRVDPLTGENTLIGDAVTPGGLSGLAFDAQGRLWGSTIFGRDTTSTLVELDTNGTTIQTVGPITDGVGGPAISIGDLAVQPGTDVLYGIRSKADNASNTSGQIYTIDKDTAVASFVGIPDDPDTIQAFGGGLAFAPDGILLRSVNQSNVVDGFLISAIDPNDASVLFSVSTGIFYDGLAVRPSDGLIFATGGGGVTVVSFPGGLEIPLLPGPANGSMSDLAFLPVATPVPALGRAWPLLVAALLAGVIALRRSLGRADPQAVAPAE